MGLLLFCPVVIARARSARDDPEKICLPVSTPTGVIPVFAGMTVKDVFKTEPGP